MEDLHWADASTRDLLVFLLRNLRDVPLHLIVSVRTDDLHRPIPSGGCCPNSNGWDRVRRIEVGPLDHGQVAAQAAAVRGAPLGRTDAALLHERTGGNPLFVESFLAADSGTPGGGPIPAGPRELLLAAVAPLDATTRKVLGLAAVAGERLAHSLLEAVVWFHTPWGHLREQESRAWLTADPEEARSRWEDHAHALGQVGFPVQRVAALGRAASAALEAEDEAAVRRLLVLCEEAVGSCDNGAALQRHHVAPLRAALGGPGGAAPAGLTRREQEVLVRLASGATNREIGEALFISPKTVSVHMSNLMGKLGVTNRNAAAARARDLGLS